jgi:hypothetical protein
MRFVKVQREIVNARRVQNPTLVLTRQGEVLATEEDWIIENGSWLEVCCADRFELEYEALDSAQPEIA